MAALSDYESTTRDLLKEHRKQEDGFAIVALGSVFRAMWASSLPFDRILTIANALHNAEFREEPMKQALKVLVRRGALRSRTERGTRFWEVNY